MERGAVMLLQALGISWLTAATILVAAPAVYLIVIVLTRLSGVRSLAKMSTFDFAATVAIGSTLSSAALSSTPLSAGALALVVFFALQFVIAHVRRRGWAQGAFDNQPILLMAAGRVLEAQMSTARVSRFELWAQLRLAGIERLEQVGAVVMETTGELSVLRAGELSPELLEGVRGAEHLSGEARA